MKERDVAYDTETWFIEERHGENGTTSPPFVCASVADSEFSQVLVGEDAYAIVSTILADSSIRIVGHNISFDMVVTLKKWPYLKDKIFLAYLKGRITDTMLREKLLDIAAGGLKPGQYSLKKVAEKRLGLHLEKEDTWRLRYKELDGQLLEEWPEDAVEYARKDAETTLDVNTHQEKFSYLLNDQYRQARAAFAFALMAEHGLVTEPERVHAVEYETELQIEKNLNTLLHHGLVERVYDTKTPPNDCGWQEVRWKVTKKHPEGKWKGLKPKYWDGQTYKSNKKVVEQAVKDHFTKIAKKVPKTSKGNIKASFDILSSQDNPLLEAYAYYMKAGSLRATIQAYKSSPVRAQYDSLKNTGRSGCSNPNLQNVRRGSGVRECFVARPGTVFLGADYSSLELHTFAQVCINLLGYSTLAEALNTKKDAHTMMGARLLGIGYEEALRRKKEGDVEAKKARQDGKIGNFGFNGGMGPQTLSDQVKGAVSVPRAREIKAAYLSEWVEASEYFKLNTNGMDDKVTIELDDGTEKVVSCGTVEHEYTNRYASKLTFCKMCNYRFQGLGADGMKQAMWDLTWAMWMDNTNPLYGSRLVLNVHDEIMCETKEENLEEKALAFQKIMCDSMNMYLPDVPVRAEPVISRCWMKDAEGLYDEEGDIIIHDKD